MPALRLLLLNWRDHLHPEAGGAEKYLVMVAEGLAQRGHHVTFRTSAYPGALADETVAGVHYVRRGGKYSIYPRALLAQLARRHRADVVVDVQNGVPYLTPLVRRGAVVNLVHHVHREQWPVLFPERAAAIGWWVESRLAPWIYRRHHYVAVSQSTRRELGEQGIAPDRVRIIHNGTDGLPVETERTPHPSLIALGRLVPQKRFEIAIATVAALTDDFPDLTLTIAGSGWWEPQLRDHAEALGVADRVHFVGHVSEEEKHLLLAQAWVHLLPSLKEGWGLVIVEAGIHGTPTVAFREAGGPVDAIRDGETGLLVDGEGDRPEGVEAYAAAVRTLLGDPGIRERQDSAVRDWVTRFTWESTVDHWESLLEAAHQRR